jgi:hypothetical protein
MVHARAVRVVLAARRARDSRLVHRTRRAPRARSACAPRRAFSRVEDRRTGARAQCHRRCRLAPASGGGRPVSFLRSVIWRWRFECSARECKRPTAKDSDAGSPLLYLLSDRVQPQQDYQLGDSRAKAAVPLGRQERRQPEPETGHGAVRSAQPPHRSPRRPSVSPHIATLRSTRWAVRDWYPAPPARKLHSL